MKFIDKKILDNEDTATSPTSDAVLLDQIYGYAVQASLTGAPSGSLKIQASCQIIQGTETVSEWADVTNGSMSISSSGSFPLLNFDGQHYKYIRVVYTNTGGSGDITVTYNGKG